MFLSAGCSLLRAKGFFRSLDVVYEGQGINKLQLMIKIIFLAVIFVPVYIFGHQNPGSEFPLT
jgi:hypothetical protein